MDIDLLSESDLAPTGTFRNGRPEYRLGRELRFEDVTVPAGFVVDGYSMPGRLINWRWQPRHARWKTPATLHDWLYETMLMGEDEAGRRSTDNLFMRAMTVVGVKSHHRWIAWAAVRVGGRGGYGLISPQNRELVAPWRRDLDGLVIGAGERWRGEAAR